MPATLPCPKIPRQPSNSRCSTPSRSEYWFLRNLTMACATVMRVVMESHSTIRMRCDASGNSSKRLASFWDRSANPLLHQWQPRVRLFPRRPEPDMVRIFGYRQGARRSCKKVQIVHVVSRTRDHRMKPAPYQHRIAIGRPHRTLSSAIVRIEMLQGKSFRLADAVIVDFVEVHFRWGIVHVVLMRRIARPVSPRRINLDHHQLVSWKCGRDDIDDLPRRVAASAQGAGDVGGSNQSGF